MFDKHAFLVSLLFLIGPFLILFSYCTVGTWYSYTLILNWVETSAKTALGLWIKFLFGIIAAIVGQYILYALVVVLVSALGL